MKQYTSFKQYMNIHYSDLMQKDLSKYLLSKYGTATINGIEYDFDGVQIKNFEVIGIQFTKSELDNVEFDCFVEAEFYFMLKQDNDFKYFKGNKGYFGCHFKGSFRNGFKLSNSKTEMIDRKPFTERLTKALVHVIDKEKMELYATKFLKYYCPEALKKPMPLDLTKILNDKGVYWYRAPLTSGVYGKTYFADDIAEVYDENGDAKTVKVSRGTILINPSKHEERGNGALRNTIVHEAVHWFFHSNYFEHRLLLDNKLTCAVCYKSDRYEDDDDIKWMESQARSLAPKILMPKKMFLKKYKETYAHCRKTARALKNIFGLQRKIDTLSDTIEILARFFEVSKLSVKYRLIELGITEADGVLNWNEESRRYFPTFQFNTSRLKHHQTFFVSQSSYFSLIQNDNEIEQADRKSVV